MSDKQEHETVSTAVEQAYDALLAYVSAAPEGSRLPGERDLVASLGVSRSTLRSAIDRLARLGVLEVRRGSGTIVRRPEVSTLALPYRELLSLSPAGQDELLELRRILEPRLAGMAARRRSEEELSTISRLAQSSDPLEPTFYEAVARSSRNGAAAELVALLLELSSQDDHVSAINRSPATLALLIQQRSVVAAAIAAYDPIAARRSMSNHLGTVARQR